MKVDAPTITKIANLTKVGYVMATDSDGAVVAARYGWSVDPYYTDLVYPVAGLTAGDGDKTVGNRFYVRGTCSITGAVFRTAYTANPHTIRVKLWDAVGTVLKTVDVVCAGAGQYTATFATAYTVSDLIVGSDLYISMWETSGTKYTYSATTVAFAHMVSGALNVIVNDQDAAGDAFPSSVGAAPYPIDPVLVYS